MSKLDELARELCHKNGERNVRVRDNGGQVALSTFKAEIRAALLAYGEAVRERAAELAAAAYADDIDGDPLIRNMDLEII